MWRGYAFEKHNGLYWHKILIIDDINKAIRSLFAEVLLPWNLLAKGRGYQWPWSLIPKPSLGKLLGHPAPSRLLPLVLLHLESSLPASCFPAAALATQGSQTSFRLPMGPQVLSL